jgi:hypothetical protein
MGMYLVIEMFEVRANSAFALSKLSTACDANHFALQGGSIDATVAGLSGLALVLKVNTSNKFIGGSGQRAFKKNAGLSRFFCAALFRLGGQGFFLKRFAQC